MAQMSTSDLPRIGDVIRAWRIFRGLRSTELAARAGVRSQYLSEIEHNRTNNPKEDYLQKLANALGVPLKDILGRGMPPKEGGRVTTPSSKQRLAGQESQQVSEDEDEDDETVKPKQQTISPPLTTTSRAALALSDSRLDATFDQIEAYFESKHFSKEQMETAAIELFESAKQIARLIKPEHE